jgi:hypothetical protein
MLKSKDLERVSRGLLGVTISPLTCRDWEKPRNTSIRVAVAQADTLLWNCVCIFTYSSWTEKPICTKIGILIPWATEEIFERSKLRKNVLSSNPSEGGSCSSETKHDRRTASRPKLFVSKRRLQKQRPQPRKLHWVRVPVKTVSAARKLSTIENSTDQSFFFWWGDYRNKG